MALTSSMEDYLKAVLMIQQRHGYVRCVDVAEKLGVSKPSVSRQPRNYPSPAILSKDMNGTLSLTEIGLQLAEQLYEKHRFFTEQLIAAGVDPKIAEQDACSIEHAIGAESFQKLKDALGHH